jgi:hypothetical protein
MAPLETRSVHFKQPVEFGPHTIPEGTHQITPNVAFNEETGKPGVVSFQLDVAGAGLSLTVPIEIADQWDASGVIEVL